MKVKFSILKKEAMLKEQTYKDFKIFYYERTKE